MKFGRVFLLRYVSGKHAEPDFGIGLISNLIPNKIGFPLFGRLFGGLYRKKVKS